MGLRERILYRDEAASARSRWDRVGPHRIHSRVAAAPAGATQAVLVHGFGMSSRYMMPTAVRLAPDLAAIAPDLPGFGRSPGRPGRVDVPRLAAVLLDWMDAVGIERPVLVGNSFGCAVAAEAAALRPGEVAALVLVGPTADTHGRSVAAQALRLARDALREPPSLLALCALDYSLFTARGGMGLARRAVHHPIVTRLSEVRRPVLVVRGERDPIAPARWCRELVARTPATRLVTVPRAPHAVNYTNPGALARIVREFAAEAGAGGGAPPPAR